MNSCCLSWITECKHCLYYVWVVCVLNVWGMWLKWYCSAFLATFRENSVPYWVIFSWYCFTLLVFFSYCKKRGLCFLIWGWLRLGEPLARKKKLLGEKNAIKLICYVAMTYDVVNALMNLPLKHCGGWFWLLIMLLDQLAVGFTVFTTLLLSWALTFSTIGGEQLFGLVWDKLLMYNVAARSGLTGWI